MKTYTPQQVADLLQLNITTGQRFARTGRLPGSRLGRHWRFTEQDIERFLEQERPTIQPGSAK